MLLAQITCECDEMAISLDVWTSIAKQSWLALTGHYIDVTFTLKNVCVDYIHIEHAHTGVNIANYVQVCA